MATRGTAADTSITRSEIFQQPELWAKTVQDYPRQTVQHWTAGCELSSLVRARLHTRPQQWPVLFRERVPFPARTYSLIQRFSQTWMR